MSESSSYHRARILSEIQSGYTKILNAVVPAQEKGHEMLQKHFLLGLELTSDIHLAYICGFISKELVERLSACEARLKTQTGQAPVALETILEEAQKVDPRFPEMYRACVTPEKSKIIRYLRYAGALNALFYKNCFDETISLDLCRYDTLTPWVSVTDNFEDLYFKFSHILKILNFYYISSKKENLLTPALNLVYSLIQDYSTRVCRKLLEIADQEKNEGHQERITSAAGLMAKWFSIKLPPLSDDLYRMLQANLYNRMRRTVVLFTKGDENKKKALQLFDKCMDFDGKFAQHLIRCHSACHQKRSDTEEDTQFMAGIMDEWLSFADDYQSDHPMRAQVSEEHIQLAALGAGSVLDILWWTGLVNEDDYFRMNKAWETRQLRQKGRYNPEERILLPEVFKELMTHENYVLPLRNSYPEIIKRISVASELTDYVFLSPLPDQDRFDTMPPDLKLLNLAFPEPEACRIARMATFAAYVPEEIKVRSNIDKLVYNYWREALAPLAHIEPHKEDPEVSFRTYQMKQVIEQLFPHDKILSLEEKNKLMMQTEKKIERTVTHYLKDQETLLVMPDGAVKAVSRLSAKEVVQNDIDVSWTWQKIWRQAFDRSRLV